MKGLERNRDRVMNFSALDPGVFPTFPPPFCSERNPATGSRRARYVPAILLFASRAADPSTRFHALSSRVQPSLLCVPRERKGEGTSGAEEHRGNTEDRAFSPFVRGLTPLLLEYYWKMGADTPGINFLYFFPFRGILGKRRTR